MEAKRILFTEIQNILVVYAWYFAVMLLIFLVGMAIYKRHEKK
jgi:hypothetical protein